MPLINSKILRYPLEIYAINSLTKKATQYMDRYMKRNGWSGGEENVWAPCIDIYEKPESFLVRVELPDVKPEDIDVTTSDNTISIEGEEFRIQLW